MTLELVLELVRFLEMHDVVNGIWRKHVHFLMQAQTFVHSLKVYFSFRLNKAH